MGAAYPNVIIRCLGPGSASSYPCGAGKWQASAAPSKNSTIGLDATPEICPNSVPTIGPGGWDSTFNVWHVSRPFIGAITGSMGAVIYLVLLELGNKATVSVDVLTFYVAAFAFGFADSAFLEVLKNITNILIKPGNKQNDG